VRCDAAEQADAADEVGALRDRLAPPSQLIRLLCGLQDTMYQTDERDRVIPLQGVPQSCTGAPCPTIVSDEQTLLLAYYVAEPDPNWDGTYARVVSPDTRGRIAVITFRPYSACMFGPPNDEAFAGHPLASRGLEPYGAFCVEQSSWIRKLEQMNSVHPQHNPELFAHLVHYVFAFHDSTFECVAGEGGFGVVVEKGTMHDVVARLGSRLG
jgi:hypothetical protein